VDKNLTTESFFLKIKQNSGLSNDDKSKSLQHPVKEAKFSLTYIKEFDSLRALSVLSVMFSHYFGQFKFSGLFGFAGVTFFFVLSGYLITQILLKEKESVKIDLRNNTSKLGSVLKVFYLRRSLRIFPIYYLTLMILVLLNIDSARSYFLYHFFYASNFLYSFAIYYDHLSHFWSLAVEEQFYLVWPLLILLLPFGVNQIRFFWLLIVASVLFKFCMVYFISIDSLAVHYMMPSCIESFAFGALALLIGKKRILPNLLIRLLAGSFGLFLLLQILPVISSSPFIKLISTVLSRTFFSFSSAIILVLVIKNNHKGFFYKMLNNRVLLLLGKISYGIYIYHMFVPGLLGYLQTNLGFDLRGTGLHMPLNFLVTFLIAYTSFVLIETPINNLKKKFRYK
jgi:peptidoglycan/LPS O-acetylase OafA/YrhL